MQISVPAIFEKIPKQESCGSRYGFTFLEILVVLTLALIIFGTVLPQFLAFFSKPIEKEFKHINAVLKTLRNDAVLKNNSYCLIFDLKLQQLMTSEEFYSGECSKEFFEKPDSLKPHDFPEDLILREANLVESSNIGASSANEFLEVHINSSGFVSPFMVVFSLADVSNSWIIETKGIMGKLLIREQ
jgi:prepilin-type N-terminal cleavage/methylation domain-containing protein